MKAKEIQDLISFISESGLDEVNIETGEFKLKVKKNSEVKTTIVEAAQSAPVQVAAAATAPVAVSTPVEAEAKSKYIEIKSPMIGTFYRASGPDVDNFVEVGDKIETGQPVCIIEAMKLFNEIESELSGTIIKVLVDNASPIEYDQPLFLVDPS